jgi:alpha-glucosidase
MTSLWWRSAVLYEIYVRSFADADGDGVGDLVGIRSRLPYLRELGVDGIWLTPFYPSPGVDHGYDVADYTDVDPQFGTLSDFDALIDAAHELDLRVVIDIVPNHTSSDHEWFRNALSSPDHPDRARYVFRPGKDGGPPNNWTSAFGGPAWTLDEASGEYYLHFFSPQQPDLDWHNPAVQADFEDVLRFWFDRGVDGFRIDVAQALFKAKDLHDMEEPNPRTWHADWVTAINQPEVHDLYRSWRRLADEYPREPVFVGEIVLRDQAAVARYLTADQLQLAFNFSLLHERWDAGAMRETIDATRVALDAVDAAATWVFENHDVTRLPTRYGGGEDGRRRARAAALLLLALPGTAFLYQGQELGLEEVELRDDQRQDPIFVRSKGQRLGRDGCRVPIPWEGEAPPLGFTTGIPWLPMPKAWVGASVAAQQGDPASSLALYRAALAARRGSRALLTGSFEWRASAAGSLVFARTAGDETVVCAVNVDADPFDLPEGDLLLQSQCLTPARSGVRHRARETPAAGGEAWLERRAPVSDTGDVRLAPGTAAWVRETAETKESPT